MCVTLCCVNQDTAVFFFFFTKATTVQTTTEELQKRVKRNCVATEQLTQVNISITSIKEIGLRKIIFE